MKRVKLYNIENTIANLRTSKRKSAWSYATDLDTVVYFQGVAKTEKHVYTLNSDNESLYAINNLSVSGISVSGTISNATSGVKIEGAGPDTYVEVGYGADDTQVRIQASNKISISASNSLDLYAGEDGNITLHTRDIAQIIISGSTTISNSNGKLWLNNGSGNSFLSVTSAGDMTIWCQGDLMTLQQGIAGSLNIDIAHILCPNMPTTSGGLASDEIWSDGGTIKIIP